MTIWDAQTTLSLTVLVLLGIAALAVLTARTADKALLGFVAVFGVVALTALALGQTPAAMALAASLGVLALLLIGARALLGEGARETSGRGSAWNVAVALVMTTALAALFVALPAPSAPDAEGLQPAAAQIWPVAAPLALAGLAVAALLGLGERAAMDQPVAPAPPPKANASMLARAAKAVLPPLMLFAVHLYVASALSPTGAVAGAAILAGGAGFYALVFGLGAALSVLRPVVLRAFAALGLVIAACGEVTAFAAPNWGESARAAASAGASLWVFAGLTLCIFAVLGRARRIEAAGP
jgi:multisubunit Na+/H+ antiporter MnhB subunit